MVILVGEISCIFSSSIPLSNVSRQKQKEIKIKFNSTRPRTGKMYIISPLFFQISNLMLEAEYT